MRFPACSRLFCALLCALPALGFGQHFAAVEGIAVRPGISASVANIDIDIQISSPSAKLAQDLATRSLILRDPDRIVFDFSDSVPARRLRTVSVNRGPLLRVRVAQFSAHPPLTRVVLDLQSPQPYHVSLSRNIVRIELGSVATDLSEAPVVPVAPPFQVSFMNGKLRVRADRATLAQILAEIQRQTGASIDYPPDATQDRVVVDLGPGLPRNVLSALLDGSRYNYVMLGSARDPDGLENVLLTLRTGGESQPAISAQPYVPPPVQPNVAPPEVPELPIPADLPPQAEPQEEPEPSPDAQPLQ